MPNITPVIQQYTTKLVPKPLLGSISKYQQFLDELRNQYLLILKTCAPKISKHFTRLTSVINEGTQYEFPSVEIHKSVINKLILKDHFKQLVVHVKREFQSNELEIRENYPRFAQSYDLFVSEVDADMRQSQTKIDVYMRDLRKHASIEYDELYIEEQNQLQENGILLADSKNRQKKKKRLKKKEKAEQEQIPEPSPPSPDPENHNQDNAQVCPAPSASQKDKK